MFWRWFTNKILFSKWMVRRMDAAPRSPEKERELEAQFLADASKDLGELENARTEMDAFYALPSAASAALRIGNHEQAESLALRALAMAPSHADNWNYGNAIHTAHTVLGLVSLERGDIAAATNQLALAGATPGSPQLNSFGPSMRLAKALAHRGETYAVLTYLQQCRQFWKMGETWLDVWEEKLRSGEIPNFPMHVHR
jgi:hypothetical protein